MRPLPKSSLGEMERRAAWRDWALSIVRERCFLRRGMFVTLNSTITT